MGIANHVKEHLVLGVSTIGSPTVLEVGVGKRFGTVGAALAFIAVRPTFTVVDTGNLGIHAIQGSIYVDCSAVAPNVRAGDMLFVYSNDTDPIFGGDDAHYYPILQKTQIGAFSRLVLAATIIGPSQYLALVVYRPVKYVIEVFDGETFITDAGIPDGADITIDFKGNHVYNATGQIGVLGIPRYGFYKVKQAIIHCPFFDGVFGAFSSPYTYDGLALLGLSDIHWEFANVGQIGAVYSAAGIVANHLDIDGCGNYGIRLYGDYMHVNNVNIMSYSEEALYLVGATDRASGHIKTASNITIYHDGVPGTLSPCFQLLGYSTSDTRFDVSNITIQDAGGNAFNGGIRASLCEVNLTNAIIESAALPFTGIVADAGTLKLHNVKTRTNGPVSFTSISSGRAIYYDTDATQTLVYAATLIINCDLGGIIQVGALTGAVAISVPLWPRVGQELLFLFTQDATAGRVITWDTVFKKAADATSTGQANKKGTTKFVYDGVNWVQLGGALSWN